MNREDTLKAMTYTDDFVEGIRLGLNFMFEHDMELPATDKALRVADLYRLVKNTVQESSNG